jgi:hypothetical protein
MHVPKLEVSTVGILMLLLVNTNDIVEPADADIIIDPRIPITNEPNGGGGGDEYSLDIV